MCSRTGGLTYGIKFGTAVLDTYNQAVLRSVGHDSNSNTWRIPLGSPVHLTIENEELKRKLLANHCKKKELKQVSTTD